MKRRDRQPKKKKRYDGRNRLCACALSLVLFLILGCGCGASSRLALPVEREVFAMDTVMALTAYGKNAENALAAAEAELFRLDALLSAQADDSAVGMLNREGSAVLDGDAKALFEDALQMYEETDGAFDMTVYPLMEAYGFPSGEYRVPEEEEIARLLEKVGSDRIGYDAESGNVRLPEGVKIDLGGIAKGYTGDLLKESLSENGIESALLNLGGNVAVLGTKPDGSLWRVAVRDPSDPSGISCILSVRDVSVVTSGGYERYFEKDGKTYHHILDPKTGKCADSGLLSVTVIVEDGTEADALSTAFFVMGKEKALEYIHKDPAAPDAVFIGEDGEITATEGLRGRITSEENITFE